MQTPNSEAENTPKLTRIQRIRSEAKKDAEHLADTFDLRDCLHLERFGLEEDDINLTVCVRTGRNVIVDLDEITEVLRNFMREKFAEKIMEEKIAELLNQESP